MSTIVLSDADKERIKKLEQEIATLKETLSTLRKTNNNEMKVLTENAILRNEGLIEEINGKRPEHTLDKKNNSIYDGGYIKISRKSTKSVRRSSKGTRRSSKGTRRSSKGSIARKSAKKRKSLRRR
jgi:hypothetical protein